MKIKNRRYFTKQIIEIQKSSLKINKTGLFDAFEYEVSFEQIDNKKKIQTIINHGVLITGIFFFLVAILFQVGGNEEMPVIFTFIALVLCVSAFITRKSTVTIASHDGNEIALYFTKGTRQNVIEFADQIILATNAYLLNKYAKVDKALPIEQQLNHIQFLLNKEIITEEHYEALKNQLLGRENKSSIGFGQ